MTITPLLWRISQAVLNPLIVFLFAIALLYFFWGIFQFVMNADDQQGREEGKKNIVWGVVGMLIMFGAYSIVLIILRTFGITPTGYPFN